MIAARKACSQQNTPSIAAVYCTQAQQDSVYDCVPKPTCDPYRRADVIVSTPRLVGGHQPHAREGQVAVVAGDQVPGDDAAQTTSSSQLSSQLSFFRHYNPHFYSSRQNISSTTNYHETRRHASGCCEANDDCGIATSVVLPDGHVRSKNRRAN